MPKSMKYVLNAIPLALLAAFAWWFVNDAVRQKGVGLLERQTFPVNNIYACAAIAGGLAIGSFVLADIFATRRRQRIETVAGYLSFSFREKLGRNGLKLTGRMHLFDDWESGRNLIAGSYDGTEIRVFDFVKCCRSRSRTTAGGDDTTTRYEQTVFLIELPEHVRLSVQILHSKSTLMLTTVFGFSGIEFHSGDAFLTDDDQQALDTFNKKYMVAHSLVPTASSANNSRDSDDLLRKLEHTISLPLIRELVNGPGWSVELCESHVAIWIHNKRIRPQDIPDRMNDVLAIVKQLSDGADASSALKLTATGDASLNPALPFRQFGLLAGSGCLGMFLAAALFAPIFFLFVQQAPWLVFVWPVFGAAVVAATVWAAFKIASR